MPKKRWTAALSGGVIASTLSGSGSTPLSGVFHRDRVNRGSLPLLTLMEVTELILNCWSSLAESRRPWSLHLSNGAINFRSWSIFACTVTAPKYADIISNLNDTFQTNPGTRVCDVCIPALRRYQMACACSNNTRLVPRKWSAMETHHPIW